MSLKNNDARIKCDRSQYRDAGRPPPPHTPVHDAL